MDLSFSEVRVVNLFIVYVAARLSFGSPLYVHQCLEQSLNFTSARQS